MNACLQENDVIGKTQYYVKAKLLSDTTGHDWWHIKRVTRIANFIAKEETANLLIVELTALLYGIANWKLHVDNPSAGTLEAREWMENLGLEAEVVTQICENIEKISFKGAKTKVLPLSREGQIVQDALRIDALGAIGIARAFTYGGVMRQILHDPLVEPHYHQTFEEYKNRRGSTINYFYEKILLLKDSMKTKTGKKIAEKRHQYTEEYLERFLREWETDLSEFQ